MSTRYGDRYNKYTSSFSGSDCIVSLVFPDARPVTMGTATTITYSIYRQLAQVRTLGRISSKGYARGGVTYAGTIIFTVINESFVEEVRRAVAYLGKFRKLRPDELPPFDIVMTFGNEFGQSSSIVIYSASFTDETKTVSVEDIFTENVLTFLARDIQHMKNNKSSQQFGKSGSFRGNNEVLGKFKLADLIATQENADRKKRLEDLARREKARWKEPVLTNPGTAPSDSAGGGNWGGDITAPPDTGGGGGSGNTPGGTPPAKTHGSLKIQVLSNGVALQGATVYYDDPMGGGRISRVSDKTGYVSFSPRLEINFKYTATKSGYKTASDTIQVKRNSTVDWSKYKLYLNKTVTSGPGGNPELKENVAYATYDGPQAYNSSQKGHMKIAKSWAKGQGPRVKLTNYAGGVMAGIPVEFKYHITNYDKCPWIKRIPFKLAWSSAKGGLGMAYTDGKGVVSLPVFAAKDLFDGAYIKITAEPYLTKSVSNGKTGKSLWREWNFFKDDGGW